MKYLVFILLLISSVCEGQSRYVIRADSTQLEKVGGNNELILLNGTRTRTGAYLKNTGTGRTGFFYAVDSAYISGGNLVLVRGGGSQNVTVPVGSGTVTSVGLTMPSAFTVGGSPVTTAGTLAVTGAGTTSQYIRGDGSLAATSGIVGVNIYNTNGSLTAGRTVDFNGNDLTFTEGDETSFIINKSVSTDVPNAYGLQINPTITGTNTGDVHGLFVNTTKNSSGTLDYSKMALLQYDKTDGITTNSYGLEIAMNQSGSGNITNAYAVISNITPSDASTITNAYGYDIGISVGGSAAITNAYMFRGQGVVSGVTTNLYGLQLGELRNATNNYGIYIDTVAGGTNNFAIYTRSGNVRFGGLANNSSDRLIGQLASNNQLGYVTLGSGLSLSSGVLNTSGTVATPISSLTGATAGNTINNGNNNQWWQWNTLAGVAGLRLSSSSTALTGFEDVLRVEATGTNATSGITSYGLSVINGKGGTTSTNVAGYFSATSGTAANYAAQFARGKVAIGTAGLETGVLEMNGATSGTATIRTPAAAGTPTLTLPIVTGTIVQYVNGTTTSSATPTPTGDAKENNYSVTALAEAATFGAPSGTPTAFNTLLIRIKDNSTVRTLAWNAIYRAGTELALPTTTVDDLTMYVYFVYNSTDSKWDLVGLTQGF